MRIVTWNLERKNPTAPRGAEALDYFRSLAPEVAVATEARTSFSLGEGESVWASPPRASRFAEDERKVVLWSVNGLERVDFDSPIDPTRFVAARTDTSIGTVLVLGICITWHMAEVTYHSGPKKKPWEEHLEYLEHLTEIFDSIDEPFVAAGDYNQRIPRVKGGNIRAAEALTATFDGLNIVTTGTLPGCTRPGIDHIATSPEFTATNIKGWPNDVTGNRLSDHDGAMCELKVAR